MIKYIYDLEVFPDFFSATFLELEGDKVAQWDSRNPNSFDLREFVKGKHLISAIV